MSEPETLISLSLGQIASIAGILVAGIGALWRFVIIQSKAAEKSNAQQITLLRSHIQSLEMSRTQDRADLQSLNKRAQDLENRSFSFLETMSARQAQIVERLSGIAQHTANVLDEMSDSMHRLQATDTALHVAMKSEVEKIKTKSKNLSGEHKV